MTTPTPTPSETLTKTISLKAGAARRASSKFAKDAHALPEFSRWISISPNSFCSGASRLTSSPAERRARSKRCRFCGRAFPARQFRCLHNPEASIQRPTSLLMFVAQTFRQILRIKFGRKTNIFPPICLPSESVIITKVRLARTSTATRKTFLRVQIKKSRLSSAHFFAALRSFAHQIFFQKFID